MIKQSTNISAIPAWASWRAKKIRIAIIDTGVDDEDDNLIEAARQSGRVKDCCGFINDSSSNPDYNDYKDVNGHGTHVARLMLEVAPAAEIFIAKVSNETTIEKADLVRIARVSSSYKDISFLLVPCADYTRPSDGLIKICM
jgi:subtilisin family serine protease